MWISLWISAVNPSYCVKSKSAVNKLVDNLNDSDSHYSKNLLGSLLTILL